MKISTKALLVTTLLTAMLAATTAHAGEAGHFTQYNDPDFSVNTYPLDVKTFPRVNR